MIKKIQKEADSRMVVTYRFLQDRKMEKLKLREWKTYTEKYEYRIEQIYEVIDNPQAGGPSSKWDYTLSGLKGHDKAISQTRERSC